MTDSQSDADSRSPKPRGLWSLMGTPPSLSSQTSPEIAKHENPPEAEVADEQAEKLRDLSKKREAWKLKQPSALPPTEQGESEAGATEMIQSASSPDLDEFPKARAKSLFATMRRATEVDEVTPEEIDDLIEDLDHDESCARDNSQIGAALTRIVDVQTPENDIEEEFESADHLEPTLQVDRLPDEVFDLTELEPPHYSDAQDKGRRQCWISFVAGLVSIAMSTLALLPQFWSSIPATLLGFTAIIAGYLPLTGTVRRRIPTSVRVASLSGMFLGTIGIFLGPLLFSSLGRNLRESTGFPATLRHLTQLSGALDRYYGEKESFPIGGTFERNEAGVIKGQHGWMTFLLPFVGESDLYHQIDQSKPFDDAANRVAMGREVSVYFAAGGDRSRIGQGFSVSHFAGLGGEIDSDSGLSHIGVFERDVAVKREEVADGLSKTLIVGELAGGYPPWGDPENWRKIGRGLNKDPNGFGSAGGHGASFLFADGTVKFFSNKTDPKILERLSTRDGSE